MIELCSKGFLTAVLFDLKSEFDKESIENEMETFFTKAEQISFYTGKFGLRVHKLPIDYACNSIISFCGMGVPEYQL